MPILPWLRGKRAASGHPAVQGVAFSPNLDELSCKNYETPSQLSRNRAIKHGPNVHMILAVRGLSLVLDSRQVGLLYDIAVKRYMMILGTFVKSFGGMELSDSSTTLESRDLG